MKYLKFIFALVLMASGLRANVLPGLIPPTQFDYQDPRWWKFVMPPVGSANSYILRGDGSFVSGPDALAAVGVPSYLPNFYPEFYGAAGDGVTNDTGAIQTAINLAAAAGGGVVQCSGKVYLESGLVWPQGTNAPVYLVGIPFGPMFSPVSPSVTTSPGYTVFRSPSGGGDNLIINGSGSGSQCFYATIQNIVFEGPAGAASLTSENIGVKIGEFAQWTNVFNCTFAFFGDEGLWTGGIDCKIQHCYAVYCLRRQPRTRISGAVEVYGTDQHIDSNEFSGIQVAENAMTDPTNLFNNALLIQCANSEFSDDICEGADNGMVLVGKVNSSSLPNGFSYPDQCIGNAFNHCRPSNNWGNGLQCIQLNGQYPQDNAMINMTAANNGLDVTSVRTSKMFGISSASSDASFLINGQGNILASPIILQGATPANLYYGVIVTDQTNLGNGLNKIINPRAQTTAYSLGLGCNSAASNATFGSTIDSENPGVENQTPSAGALDITGASTIMILDGSAQTITSITTTENQGTAWSSATTYASGQIVSQGGAGYICIAATTNNQPPNGSFWTALNPFPRYGQRVRLVSQHGKTTIALSAVQSASGKPIQLARPYSYVDIQLNQGQGTSFTWTQVGGTPSLFVNTGTVTPGAIGANTVLTETFAITGSAVGDSIVPRLGTTGTAITLNGCILLPGQVFTAGTGTYYIWNPTTGSLTPTAGTIDLMDQN